MIGAAVRHCLTWNQCGVYMSMYLCLLCKKTNNDLCSISEIRALYTDECICIYSILRFIVTRKPF